MKIGLDIGSTTIKCVVLGDTGEITYKSYERHFSRIVEKTAEILTHLSHEVLPKGERPFLAVSGSAGMGMAENNSLPFVQEVYATRICAKRLCPEVDSIIELGGEDAKILFLSDGLEVRMNGSCAGGTGAFIDQMATLLNITPEEMNSLAATHEKIYTIASRCGVFAKSDIQPLVNQGARIADISASIFYAVVNQTISGLAQGREIKGNILYLGGPLHFLSELRRSFDDVLKTTGIHPENSLYYVALGAAFSADQQVDLEEVANTVSTHRAGRGYTSIAPLFSSPEEYEEFRRRQESHKIPQEDLAGYNGPVYLGIDVGSTTVKAVAISEDGKLLSSYYRSNSGNPVPIVREFLLDLYKQKPDINISSSAVTGYGEEIVKNAFDVDFGLVETVAHFTAAKQFLPEVEFVIDIGGQDIKCFQIRSGTIDNIFLNEACSSGCGSFLQTFANALGYSIEDFAKLGLFAKKPVDLGSRCTVFMNSSVKQAQKDGATIEDISAGLSISVVKNALYKVIRATSAEQLGRYIVVQGGTFLNDAVLRAFEQELKTEVVRPSIAGLMGAYGAALFAKERGTGKSGIITKEALDAFTHKVSVVQCGLCNNHCSLTVNDFGGGKKYIGGNRCDRPVRKNKPREILDMFADKLQYLADYKAVPGKRGAIGIPMGLNMYELLPFWHAFFTSLGFEVVTSPLSNRQLYLKGQHTIPSDTVCYPAKLMHGHVEALIEQGITTIFYPCMSYNFDEDLGDNHYNCPVVAYYPEVISANMQNTNDITFIKDYVGIHRTKDFPKKMTAVLAQYFDGIVLSEVKAAAKAAYAEYAAYMQRVRDRGDEVIARARELHMPIVVLAGRPYHLDPEINHGIDQLIADAGAAVVTEDAVSWREKRFPVKVLNQWTYHSRLYASARYVGDQKDMNVVQLVSFGCGVDAITTDEMREILEREGKIYTQIKIDEITNLGAVKIRLRSLFAASGNGM